MSDDPTPIHDRGEEYAILVSRFDFVFYLQQCPELVGTDVDPVQHYMQIGWREGRDPSPEFSTDYYLEIHTDIAAAGKNPYVHYIEHGRDEGRLARPSSALQNARPESPAPPPPQPETAGADERAGIVVNAQNSQADRLRATGLFDVRYYLDGNPDARALDQDPLEHFLEHARDRLASRKPNFYFDPAWYLDTNPDVAATDINPLLHYALAGEAEGRKPCLFFDPAWYARTYQLGAGSVGALAHYLRHRSTGRFSPIPEFDMGFYCRSYPDIATAGIDPFEHYIRYGFREDRRPSPHFDGRFYRQSYLKAYPDQNPLLHYLLHRHAGGFATELAADVPTLARQVREFTRPGPLFEEIQSRRHGWLARAKVLAFYLPQFHSFEENNEWWGTGFTEWTNVARGVPRFAGHYQPRIPRDLGYYSLDSIETMRLQAEMAERAGLGGFVFYFYWFNRKRLLQQPLDMFVAEQGISFPFCLMWANENWSRRWDGSESDVLISQDYDPADDEALVETFARYFASPKYIRIRRRPLLMIYRVSAIPDAAQRIARWRTLFEERHGETPIIIMAQTFNDDDPTIHGLDGAVEFPPHGTEKFCSQLNHRLDYFDMDAAASVISYDDVVARYSLTKPRPAYPLIKTILPGWDNDARRQGLAGLVVHGSTPAKYQAWLEQLIEQADEHRFFDERLICVNAWNEWGEGAYLEPDLHFGGAYLNATGRAVHGAQPLTTRFKMLLIGHDAFRSGAQTLLLEIARFLRKHYSAEIEVILLGGGELLSAYQESVPTTVCDSDELLGARLAELHARGFGHAVVNTAVAAYAGHALKRHGYGFVLLVHELPGILRSSGHASHAGDSAKLADTVVFADTAVREGFEQACNVSLANVLIRAQGNYQRVRFSAAARETIRAQLGVDAGACLAIGVGYADLRKGFDLFLQAWHNARRHGQDVCFVWVGDMHPWIASELEADIRAARATGSFHLPGFRKNMADYLSAADVFLLTSRQDPFPTAVLEALAVGIPAIAFDGSGGIPNMLRRLHVGEIAPLGDVDAMARALPAVAAAYGTTEARERLVTIASTEFGFDTYVGDLVQLLNRSVLKISVVVLSYNYAHYLQERIGSILGQSYPIYEIVVLDDASTDASVQVIGQIAAEADRDIRLVANSRNSGSVFSQWARAASIARGDYIWLAEADDSADARFLERLADMIAREDGVDLAFSDSRSIDSDGGPIWPSYRDYFAQVHPGALSHDAVFEGADFIERYMSERNLILNVSGVVWRRQALRDALRSCQDDLNDFQMAGDWRLYVEALSRGGRVGYVAEPLNVHRRHATSVTHSLSARRHVEEIRRMHAVIADKIGIGDAVRAKQESYADAVSRQLGLATEPELAPEPDEALS
jgi:glycosyltransferase involved in cell wall biosynthesis